MATIILCADDYGQNTAISQAILALLAKNRLSATSCETNSPFWSVHAEWLKPFISSKDIGLHFNLTEGKPLTEKGRAVFFPLSTLILKAYSGRLKKDIIEAELNAQLDQFIAGLGCEPHFIDGHQHIHQLPIIRDAVLSVYEKRLRKTKCYLRSVHNISALWQLRSGFFKAIIIQFCGAYTFHKKLIRNTIPHNSFFEGIYDFCQAKNYRAIFADFLNPSSGKKLIMCHPGLQNENQDDAISQARFKEYQYFASDLFIEDLATKNVQLGRFYE